MSVINAIILIIPRFTSTHTSYQNTKLDTIPKSPITWPRFVYILFNKYFKCLNCFTLSILFL